MASWRALGSILEAPGLDFGGSGLDFPRFWTSETMPEGFSLVANTLPPTCPASLGHSRAKSGRDLAEPQDVCLECLCFLVLAAMGEVLTEWVAGGVPPQGVFNPPATEGVPTACRTQVQLALSNHSWPISTFFRAVRSRNSI